MANPIGRQSADFLKTGKGKVFAEEIDENGVAISEMFDVGNLESATISLETESTPYGTNEDDNQIPVRTKNSITGATLAMVCRNHNPIVTMLSLQSDVEEHAQPAVPAGTYEDARILRVGSVVKLEHENITSVTSVTDTAGAVELLVNEHYKVDADGGFIKIVALPGAAESITGLEVAYVAGAVTVDQYGGFSKSTGKLMRVYIRETGEGPKGTYTFFRVRVTADGEQGIIADGTDPSTRSFTCSMEQDETKPANYGLFLYRKHIGSI